jgi:bifunctional non-homologous end joining protein LigD
VCPIAADSAAKLGRLGHDGGAMIDVSNAARVVFPEIGGTKGDVVTYYERIAPKALPHLLDRPLSIRRFPKGLVGPGFFQKNVPGHYPASIERLAIPRSKAATKKHARGGGQERNVTVYPVVQAPEHLAYLANQGAIELHVPTVRRSQLHRPDRLVIDLDPPAGAFALARRAALLTRDALAEHGLQSVPVATGSKGYHIVAPIEPALDADELALALQKFAALLAARHPDELTTAFRIALRNNRVFLDWLRIGASASVVAPYSLRATPRATVAVPLAWHEIEATDPDAFAIGDVDRLLARPDSLVELARTRASPSGFVASVDAAFERSGLMVEPFDRFRS